MPAIPEVIATFDKLKALHVKKNNDYSRDRGPFFNFEFCSWLSQHFTNAMDKVYAVFIAVKLARLAVLLSTDKEPANESIEDSFDDFITYAAIWKANWKERTNSKRLSEARINQANTV
jgi:hypothetical protein